ncbi:MAG: hypothetical protein AAF763_17360 [Pseudomonadota bacterium]
MIIRLAIVALVLLLIYMVWRNLGLRTRFKTEQTKAWDEPLKEGSAVILTASAASWWWFLALAAAVAVSGRMLFERFAAGDTFGDAVFHVLLFLALSGVAARRAIQLSEKVTVTWDRLISRTLLGPNYDVSLREATGVTETDRTALIAFQDGRVLELSPWLDGRFWLARELRKRFEGEAA